MGSMESIASAAGIQREAWERAVLAATTALWPGADGGLGTGMLLAYLAGQGHEIPSRSLYLMLESLQQGGLVRLSRGNPHRAAEEAHGARTITWVNPAILD